MDHNNAAPRSGNLKFVFIVFMIFAIYFFLHIGKPLFAPDETRYMEISREMIETGDFISPKLDGVRYFEKPVLGYWLVALSQSIFGINQFAARLPSILATMLMALMTALAVKRLPEGSDYYRLAAVIFLFMPMPFAISSVCSLDAMFSCAVTATIVSFFFAVQALENRKSDKLYYLLLVLTGVFAGLAFLIKGFLAYALPVLAVLPWLIITKRWKVIFQAPWIPFFVSLFVIAPWAWAIHREEPDYWRYFVVVEHLQRFLGQEEAQHAKNPFYFFATLAWGTATWLVFLPVLAIGWKKVSFKQSGVIFLLSWALGPFLFLSASSGKLAPYILPCFPPIAAIIALGFHRYFENTPVSKWSDTVPENPDPAPDAPTDTAQEKPVSAPDAPTDTAQEKPVSALDEQVAPQYPPCKCLNVILWVLLGSFLVAFPVAILFLAKILPDFNPETNTFLAHFMKKPFVLYEDYERWKFNLIAIAGIFAILALFGALREKKPSEKFAFILLLLIPFFSIAYFLVPGSVYECSCPSMFIGKCDDYVDDDTLIISHNSKLIHATCLHFLRSDVNPFRLGELEYGMTNYNDNKVVLVDWNGVSKFLQKNPGKKVVLFSPYDRFLQYGDAQKYKKADLMPKPDVMVLSSDYKDRHSVYVWDGRGDWESIRARDWDLIKVKKVDWDPIVMALYYNGSDVKESAPASVPPVAQEQSKPDTPAEQK